MDKEQKVQKRRVRQKVWRISNEQKVNKKKLKTIENSTRLKPSKKKKKDETRK